MGQILKRIQEINNREKMLQSVLGKRSIESNIIRMEKLIFALAEEIDKEVERNIKIVQQPDRGSKNEDLDT